jgi:hypothetical protein
MIGKGPMPAPRWYGKRLSSEIGAVEYGYLMQALDRLVEADSPSPEPSLPASAAPASFTGASDNDLLHLALGAAT